MVKRLRFDESGVKKGAWSEDEDEKLRAYIQRYGHWNWSLLPKFAGVSRSGKSCRLRWMNYLRPNLKHGNFTKEEDDTIVNLHNKLGNKWSAMAAMLQGRSDNAIKNRWNTHLKKRVQVRQSALNLEPDQVNPQQKVVKESDQKVQHEGEVLRAGVSYESSISSSSTESSSCLWSGLDFAVSSDVTPQVCDYEPVGSFWTEPFLLDSDSIISSPLNLADEFIFPSCEDMMMTGEFLLSKFD